MVNTNINLKKKSLKKNPAYSKDKVESKSKIEIKTKLEKKQKQIKSKEKINKINKITSKKEVNKPVIEQNDIHYDKLSINIGDKSNLKSSLKSELKIEPTLEPDSNKVEIIPKYTDSKTKPYTFYILGTSHVSKESVKEIENIVNLMKPDIICVELDKDRLNGLLSDQKTSMSPKLIFKFGLFGYLFGLIGHFVQQKIGRKLNIVPGKDMLTAVQVADKNKIPVALVDQNISITLKNISKKFTFKERCILIFDIIKGFIFPKKSMNKMKQDLGIKELDLNKVPSDELVIKMITHLSKRYPGLHEALVKDRNIYMSNNIYNYFKKNPLKKALIVVGAGHKDEMIKLINKKLLNLEYVGSD